MARPRKLPDVNAAETGIRRFLTDYGYDQKAKTFKITPTKNGFALSLGYNRAEEMLIAIRRGDAVSQCLARAMTLVESWWEARLASDRGSAAGPVFWLKNQGWKDVQEVKVDSEQARAITEAQEQAARALAERQIIGIPAALPQSEETQDIGGATQSIIDAKAVSNDNAFTDKDLAQSANETQ